MNPAQQLRNLLQRTRESIPSGEFCGVGVVVSANLERLPIASLCVDSSIPGQQDLAKQIAECSLYSNPCHDGFQIVSDQWQLVRRNQYFAPFPTAEQRELIGHGNVGSRYLAARFGSLMDGVLCTGLLSERDGMVVFEGGLPID
ncbi:MAG: hypothetical protein GY927_16695 [bacterium]|nr:hypothetical protein [bacterium]